MATHPGFATSVAERLKPTPNPYLDDPVGWVEQRLREAMWSAQRRMMRSVRDHRKTVVVTCNGVGKDWMGARAAGWWVDVHPPAKTRVITTAPTGGQVKGIIWQELVTVHEGGTTGDALAGSVNQTDWWIGRRQVGIGRATSEYSPASFLGLHAPYLLIVLDEAQGIESTIIQQAERLATADDVPGMTCQRILAIGNPDYEGSTLSQLCKPDSGWNVVMIGYDETPNFTGEDVPDSVRAHLIGHEFVESQRKTYGEDSPVYIASVLGQFPKDRKDGVVPWSAANECTKPEAIARAGEIRLPVELGVDVGGSERGDWTVFTGREGMHAMERPDDWQMRFGPLDADKIVDRLLDAILQTFATAVKIDVAGVGYNVVGSLRARLDNRERRLIDWPVAVLPFSASEASPLMDQRDRPRFANVKAEMWWEVGRELSKNRMWDLSALKDCPLTIPQLTDVRYERDKAERVIIEKKDDVKKRTGGSPDHAESLLLAFFTPRRPESQSLDDLPSTYVDARSRR